MGSSAINLAGPLGPEQFRNKLINGDFTFWQRGTSDTQGPASGAELNSYGMSYMSDRWFINSSVGVGHTGVGTSVPRVSVKRQGFTMGQPSLSDVGGSQYFMRVTVGAADGTGVSGVTGASMEHGNAYLQVGQRIEASDFGEWSGKTVWLSFLAKSFGNITHPTIGCRLGLQPDLDGTVAGDVVPSTTAGVHDPLSGDFVGFNRHIRVSANNINLTPEWQKFKRKFILPDFTGVTQGTDSVSSIAPLFTLVCGVSGPAENLAKSQVTDYLGLTSGFTGAFDVAQVQFEIGNDVSPFEKRHPQVELGMCQRYYRKTYLRDTYPGATTTGYEGMDTFRLEYLSSVDYGKHVNLAPPMRAIPTLTFYNVFGNVGRMSDGNANTSDAVVRCRAMHVSDSGFNWGQMHYWDAGFAPHQWYVHYTVDAEL